LRGSDPPGEPHQLDLWRVRRGKDHLTTEDLAWMVPLVTLVALPNNEVRTVPAEHP
jgi:phenylalanyl-tRNA synthetase alpha chain